MTYYSKLTGTGKGLPAKVVSNFDIEKIVNTSDEWIRTRTGIENRRIVDPAQGESTLSMSELAARSALQAACLTGSELDMIVIGTVTPDSVMPCTANQLQALLGANRAFSFDIQAACSGFMYSLSIADSFIRSGQVRNALVIGAETLSSIVNWHDRGTCVLFGDGAGAAILQRTEDPSHRVIATKIFSDGRHGSILQIPHGYSKVPPYSAEYRHDMHKVQMNGGEVFKLAVRSMVECSQAVLKENGFEVEQVDHFIFHQANLRIIDMCTKTLGIPPEKVSINLQNYGNTSAATLPICLDEAVREGRVKPGSLVLMATFGGGVTWGSALIRL
jgi:3-oxoacyl-[acyl-carrier-protein] synthase III